MSTDLEQALRQAFRETAETVVPRPDPMRRLLRRRRRRWAGFGAFLAALVVAAGAAFVPALQLGTADERHDEGHRITTGWTRNLLNSPTRGSLAGSAFQAEVEREIDAHGDNPRLNRLKVLFLGDVAGRRFLAYARYNDTHVALFSNDVAAGDSAVRLVGGGFANQRLDPLLRLTSAVTPSLVGLVPAECRIATSATGIVSGNGVVDREWTESPQGSWVARDSARPAERWRVTCAESDRPVFQGPAGPVDEVAQETDLVAAGGLTHGAFVQRWSGQIEGFGRTWTLTTTLLSGGGVAAVLASGTSGKFGVATRFPPLAAPLGDGPTTDRDDWGLMSTAISSNRDVIAIRVPERVGAHTYYGEQVLVVTTVPGAWSVMVPASPGYVGGYLDNGVDTVRTPGGVIMIKNAADTTIGWTYVAEQQDTPEYLGEKIVSDW